ncbi:MAG TPA: hypothetical protein VF599_10090 [Pyrinomonadaceae bacterium]
MIIHKYEIYAATGFRIDSGSERDLITRHDFAVLMPGNLSD